MSPLNKGPVLGSGMPMGAMRLPYPRFGARPPPPGIHPRMPPHVAVTFGPPSMRMSPPRPGGPSWSGGPPRPGGPPWSGGPPRPGGPPPPFRARSRGIPPLVPPMMDVRPMGPRGVLVRPIRPGMRAMVVPPHNLPRARPRFPPANASPKAKNANKAAIVNKLKDLELKKPWMTDEIRNEIQKKNKLYAKAKKNKDAKEWEEFKDLRNKVTRMIRDAKNEYLAKHPEQANQYQDDENTYYSEEDMDSASEEETPLYCEVCDRDFPTQNLLERHKSTHKICGIDGCTFSAHPKLVEKHITMQHCTGLYDKIKHLNTPEDIEKWIAERKRKYPTTANIELTKSAQAEKVQRGEVVERNSSMKRQRLRKGFNKNKKKSNPRTEKSIQSDEPNEAVQLYRGLQEFAGTTSLAELEEVNISEGPPPVEEETRVVSNEDSINDTHKDMISDEEEESSKPVEPVASKNKNISFLPSLVADYGSDSEEDQPEEIPIEREKPEEMSIERVKPEEKPIERIKPEEISVKTDTCKENKSPSPEKTSNNKIDEESGKTGKRLPYGKKRGRELDRNTLENKSDHNLKKRNIKGNYSHLLRSLLSRSIQHERNQIYQCIKYIADNNFFD
ncbi:nuclear fragile X mental retardation-interacting protein 1 [Orussus abietinus]|uniref:nuclear fragile X mental retardation-interacting protein 1 n=1 Tax=Orussus abietinus TaxID=222816 RepID=UPI0006252315|nr:nuclear fragile X mental retardation-interacting protein 1 [Orussus abietinus]